VSTGLAVSQKEIAAKHEIVTSAPHTNSKTRERTSLPTNSQNHCK
jgi:hypothetical protein